MGAAVALGSGGTFVNAQRADAQVSLTLFGDALPIPKVIAPSSQLGGDPFYQVTMQVKGAHPRGRLLIANITLRLRILVIVRHAARTTTTMIAKSNTTWPKPPRACWTWAMYGPRPYPIA